MSLAMKWRVMFVLCVSVCMLLSIVVYSDEIWRNFLQMCRCVRRVNIELHASYPGIRAAWANACLLHARAYVDIYNLMSGVWEVLEVVAVWLRWIAVGIFTFYKHCFFCLCQIPKTYQRQNEIDMKAKKAWKNTFEIGTCSQIVFWMSLEKLIGISTFEQLVVALFSYVDMLVAGYVIYGTVCLMLRMFKWPTWQSCLAHLVAWIGLIGNHLQLFAAITDAYYRIKDPKSFVDYGALALRAPHVNCTGLLFGEPPK
jgi:hypothetical protein